MNSKNRICEFTGSNFYAFMVWFWQKHKVKMSRNIP